MPKYIFVVGGVMSSVGKGVAAASTAKILQTRGYNVTCIKIDPYINIDAGTMNPIEHGEVFVTEDGDETDQDIGNYERFLNQNIYSINYMTTGRVYLSVIQKERNLEYKGKCVEVVPHIPEEIINRIKNAQIKSNADIVITEIGGTVGEYQNILFLEAARMMKIKNHNDVMFIMVSYMPIPSAVGEMKTKPTQFAVRTLNSSGIQPDMLLCRGSKSLDDPRKEKLGIFCNIAAENIISAPDVESIYDIPVNFEKENYGDKVLKILGLDGYNPSFVGTRHTLPTMANAPTANNQMQEWSDFAEKIKKLKQSVNKTKIGIVGKYFATGDFVLKDSYMSVIEAVKHAAWFNNVDVEIDWINSEEFEYNDAVGAHGCAPDEETMNNNLQKLKQYNGIIVPGGFGSRGVEGKINAIKFIRENNIPFFGLCYGMQLATIEYARNVLGIKDANTEEINPESKNCVIHIMHEQKEKIEKGNFGGTMRLGAYPCLLKEDSISYKSYVGACHGKLSAENNIISERHRHRYEFNNYYREQLEDAGLKVTGTSPDNNLVEIIEIPKNKFFVGVQFHPEFKSRPLNPHPLFVEFIKSGL